MTDDIASGQAAAEPSALPMHALRPEGLLTGRGTRGSNKAGPVPVSKRVSVIIADLVEVQSMSFLQPHQTHGQVSPMFSLHDLIS